MTIWDCILGLQRSGFVCVVVCYNMCVLFMKIKVPGTTLGLPQYICDVSSNTIQVQLTLTTICVFRNAGIFFETSDTMNEKNARDPASHAYDAKSFGYTFLLWRKPNHNT